MTPEHAALLDCLRFIIAVIDNNGAAALHEVRAAASLQLPQPERRMMHINEVAQSVPAEPVDVMARAKRRLAAVLRDDPPGVTIERLHESYSIDGDTKSIRMTVLFKVPADE